MPAMISLNLDGDGAWTDLADQLDQVVWLGEGSPPIEMAVLEGGMVSGRPSVAFRFDLPDGRVLVAETSVANFLAVAAAVRGRYPGLE